MKNLFSKEVLMTVALTAVVVGGVLILRDNMPNGFAFKKKTA